jgi:serine/threonine protein kinase
LRCANRFISKRRPSIAKQSPAAELAVTLAALALTRPEVEHETYLRTVCGSNLELFREAWNHIRNQITGRSVRLSSGTPPVDSYHPFKPGDVLLNRFRILREVAQGGMGIVFEATDERLERRVALKCAKSGFSKQLFPEVRNAREISHPNVCKIFEIHTAPTPNGEIDFISMEFLEGETLSERIGRGLSKGEASTIALQLCAGLAEAHRNHVIHGDLKTNNVILTSGPDNSVRAVITDFGLARRFDVSEGALPAPVLAGTPDYMAPELWKGQKPSVASDVYALGVMLWELFSGKKSSELGSNSTALSWDQRLNWRPRLGPGKQSRVIERCLQPDPAQRFQSVQKVAQALRSSAARRWTITGLAAVAAVLLCALAVNLNTVQSRRALQRLKPQRVTATSTENPVLQSSLSPDGSTIAYGNNAGIQLRRIATNETWMLPPPKGLSNEDSWWPVGWLSDHELLAASATATLHGLKLAAWAVPATPRGAAIKIRDNCIPYAVSPDGLLIAFTTGGINLHEEIWVMGHRGESPRIIVASPDKNTIFSSLHWSPDGHRIAYRLNEVDGPRSMLQSAALDGSPPVMLMPNAQLWGDFCWLANGNLVYSAAEEDDQHADMNLWQLRVNPKTGTAIGQKQQLTDWTGFRIENLSASGNGRRLAFDKVNSQTDVFVADLRRTGPAKFPRRLTLDDYDDYPFGWLENGKAVLFGSAQAGSFQIGKQTLDQDQAVPLVTSADGIGPIRQTPDGSSLLFVAYGAQSSRLMIAPQAGGASKPFGHTAGVLNVACSQKPAKTCIAATANAQGDHMIFWGFEPPNAELHQLFEVESDIRRGRSWALSPNGDELVINNNYSDHAEIEVYSPTGLLKRKVTVSAFNRFLSIDYAPDGHSWIIGSATATGCALLRVHPDGRYQVVLNLNGVGMRTYGLPSPDGKHLAYLGWTINRNTWILDLPPSQQ